MAYEICKEARTFLDNFSAGLFINNEWINADALESIEIINPATESKVADISSADKQYVKMAVDSARQCFDSGAWSDLLPTQREAIMLKFASLIEEHHQAIAEILTIENGKLIAQAKSEVMSAARTFRYYAGWTTKIEGETIDISLRQAPGKRNFAFTKREPVGVIAAIVPWNFPISIASWKLGPLLAAGCTCVLKPSEVSPLSTLYMSGLIKEAGFPPGTINIVTGDGLTGAHLTQHSSVDKITFTGSTAVGKIIGHAAIDNLTGLSLELGGKSPAVVFEDSDLEEAAKGVAMGIYRNGGQVCVAGSRAYVERTVLDRFVDLLKAEIDKMKISDGFDPEAGLGPLVSLKQLENVCAYIDAGSKEAKLVHGGDRISKKGYYLKPAIFISDTNDAKIVEEEIFGPVLVVIPFDSKQEALHLANDNAYGLSSTVWTKDIDKAMLFVNKLNAGWVFVNSVARSDPNFPIGGNKQSGMGRELGKTGLYSYTKLKSVNIVY